MDFARLKVPHVGEFKCHSFKELEELINNKDSVLRMKIEGIDEHEE